MSSRTRCSFWRHMAIVSSPMTVAATAGRASLGTATTWTPMPMTSRSLCRNWIPANARLMTAAMRDTQDFWATFMLPDDRLQITSLLARAANMVKDDEARKYLAAFAATLTAAK